MCLVPNEPPMTLVSRAPALNESQAVGVEWYKVKIHDNNLYSCHKVGLITCKFKKYVIKIPILQAAEELAVCDLAQLSVIYLFFLVRRDRKCIFARSVGLGRSNTH